MLRAVNPAPGEEGGLGPNERGVSHIAHSTNKARGRRIRSGVQAYEYERSHSSVQAYIPSWSSSCVSTHVLKNGVRSEASGHPRSPLQSSREAGEKRLQPLSRLLWSARAHPMYKSQGPADTDITFSMGTLLCTVSRALYVFGCLRTRVWPQPQKLGISEFLSTIDPPPCDTTFSPEIRTNSRVNHSF